MSGNLRTVEGVEMLWIELEKIFFEDVDRMLKVKGVNGTRFESDIHDMKSEVGEELSSCCHQLCMRFEFEFSKEGMPKSIIKSEFVKCYEKLMNVVDGRIKTMFDSTGRQRLEFDNPKVLRNLSTRFLELIDHDKENISKKIYVVSDALIDLARSLELERENNEK